MIQICANIRSEGTWITQDMKLAYRRLHALGLAHSFECWDSEGNLAGGLYGVAMGRCFFGESMFARQTDASKVAFVHLVRQLQQWDYALIDCQVENAHLRSLGAELVSRAAFLSILEKNVDKQPAHSLWRLDWHWPERESP